MIPQVERRPPDTVMRLSRLGSFHQSRISFMRVLLRRLASEKWCFDAPKWSINEKVLATQSIQFMAQSAVIH